MAQTARYTDVLDDYTVVDCDVHLRVPVEKSARYMDEPHRGRAERGLHPSDGWDRYKGGRIDRIMVETPEDLRSGLMEQFSVDHPIINPALAWLPRVPQPDYANALMRAFNDYMVDVILDEDDDIYGLAQVATQQPDKAAEELDRLGSERGIVGAYVVPMGTPVPIGDRLYDPIYDAAEKNDLTIAFHPHGTTTAMDFPKQNYGFHEYISVHTLGFVWGQMQAIVSLLEQGVPVKFPDLNFAFLEGGIGWVPGLAFRLNKEYAARREEMPLLEKQPEAYIKDWYFASQPLGEPMRGSNMVHLLEAIDAPETLMFATDYPHWDFDNPSALFGYLRSNYDDDERTRILGGNAAEAFGIDV